MNYIIYGTSTLFEKRLFEQVSEGYTSTSTLHINSLAELEGMKDIIKYPPFFSPRWLVILNLSKIGKSNVAKALVLLKNNRVQFYGRIPIEKEFNQPNKELYDILVRSEQLQKLEDLQVINSLYPSDNFIKEELFTRLNNIYLTDGALKHLITELRRDMNAIDTIVEDIMESGLREINLDMIRKIIPASQTGSLRVYVYTVLLSHRIDLKSQWEDHTKKILVSNAGTVDKPFTTLGAVKLSPRSTINIIVSILKDMMKLKKVYQEGVYTVQTIFQSKQDLEKKYPIVRRLSIPAIVEYTKVFSEVTREDLLFILTSYLELKSKAEIVEEDIYLLTVKMMNRHKRGLTTL